MPVQRTTRGYVAKTNETLHTATIRSGPRAGEAYSCLCTRRADHYVNMAPGLMDMHPKLF